MVEKFSMRIMMCTAVITMLPLLACSSSEHSVSATADTSSASDATATASNRTPNADSAAEPPPSSPTQVSRDQAPSDSMKIFLDEKGEPRDPTPAERAEMAKRESNLKATEQPKSREVKLRNGGTAIMIEGPEQTPLKACAGDDGSLAVSHSCSESKKPEQPSPGDKP